MEEVIAQCAKQSVRFAIILSGGFAEAGNDGAVLQHDLAAIGAASGLRLVGPNCQGVMNLSGRVFAGFGTLFSLNELTEGPVSVVTQSGAFGSAVINVASELGVGLRYFVSTGNEADLSVLDFIDFCLADTGTRLIATYIEAVRDGRRLMSLGLQGLRCGKPILVWKAGNSESGRRASLSHTGAMASSYALYQAAFRQVGIIEVREIQDLIDLKKVLLAVRTPEGRRVCIVTVSGGAGILIADEMAALGLELAPLHDVTIATLSRLVPQFGSLRNPIDLTGQIFTSPRMAALAIEAVAKDENVDSIIVVNASMQGPVAKAMAEELVAIAASIAKPLYVVWSARTDRAIDAYETLDRHGIPRFVDPVRCARAVAIAVRFRAKCREVASQAAAVLNRPYAARLRLRNFIDPSSPMLPEYRAKDLLEAVGIPVPTRSVVHSADDAAAEATRIGYPVVRESAIGRYSAQDGPWYGTSGDTKRGPSASGVPRGDLESPGESAVGWARRGSG